MSSDCDECVGSDCDYSVGSDCTAWAQTVTNAWAQTVTTAWAQIVQHELKLSWLNAAVEEATNFYRLLFIKMIKLLYPKS